MVSEIRIKSEMLKIIGNLAKFYSQRKDAVGVKIKFVEKEVEYEGETVLAELPSYFCFIDYKLKEEVKIERLLNIKYIPLLNKPIDPFNLINVVPTYITAALHYLNTTQSIDRDRLSVFVQAKVDEQKNETLVMWLYDGGKPVREVSSEELFNEKNVENLVAYAQGLGEQAE